jgi:hypothetical protein
MRSRGRKRHLAGLRLLYRERRAGRRKAHDPPGCRIGPDEHRGLPATVSISTERDRLVGIELLGRQRAA